MGIEPTSSAWKAEVLPLNYARLTVNSFRTINRKTVVLPLKTPTLLSRRIKLYFLLPPHQILVEGGGFEPPKAEPSDLQSDPVDRLGTPPKTKPHILEY
jgi:hypothetical protein